MNELERRKDHYSKQVRKSTRRLAFWTTGWLIATALLGFGPKLLWKDIPALTFLAAAIEIGVGIGMVLAIKRHLQDVDELQQEVQLKAMGITLGVFLIVSVPYPMLEKYGIAPFNAKIEHLLILMSLTYLACILLGLRRYR